MAQKGLICHKTKHPTNLPNQSGPESNVNERVLQVP